MRGTLPLDLEESHEDDRIFSFIVAIFLASEIFVD